MGSRSTTTIDVWISLLLLLLLVHGHRRSCSGWRLLSLLLVLLSLRVYAQQETERLRQDARLAYDLSQRTEGLLSEAYAKQAQKNRDAHAERLKRRDYQTSGKPPESAARPTRKRQPR